MERERRVLTVPNLISLVRLACVPVFVWLLVTDHRVAAGVLLAVLGASDWVDGWIARRYDQVSELGKVLDPTADRILLIAGAAALLADGVVPLLVGIVILAREVVVSLAVVALALAGARRVDVQWAGKAGTLAIMFALPSFLLADELDGVVGDGFSVLAWGFTVAGLAFGYYAAATYVPIARRALHEGRAARRELGSMGRSWS